MNEPVSIRKTDFTSRAKLETHGPGCAVPETLRPKNPMEESESCTQTGHGRSTPCHAPRYPIEGDTLSDTVTPRWT